MSRRSCDACQHRKLLRSYSSLLDRAVNGRAGSGDSDVPAGHERRLRALRAQIDELLRLRDEGIQMFDAWPLRLAVLDSNLCIVRANIAWKRDPEAQGIGGLLAECALANSGLTKAPAGSSSHGARVHLLRRSGGSRVGVLLAPLPPDFLDGSRMWVATLGPSPDPSVVPFGIRGLFGLTPAETEIAQLLLKGASSREIARRRGTRIQTVQGQIKMVLQKTGSSTRSGLVRLFTGAAPSAR